MKLNVFEGFAAIIVGIVFVVFPILFRNMLFATLPLSIFAFGVLNIFNGLNLKNDIGKKYSMSFIILGSIVIILAILISFNMVHIIKDYEFYIMGIIFIICGVIGLLSNINRIYDLSSVVIFAVGLASIILNVCSLNSDVYLPSMVGIIIIGEGFALLFSY